MSQSVSYAELFTFIEEKFLTFNNGWNNKVRKEEGTELRRDRKRKEKRDP